MKQSKKDPLVVVLVAPSGAGKNTIINALKKKNPRMAHSTSHTTRYQREGEVDHIDYHFVSEKVFEAMIKNNEFLEWAKVGGFYYGSSKKEVKRAREIADVIFFDIDVQGFLHFREQKIDALYIFIEPPSFEELRKRLEKRGLETKEQIDLRLNRAKKEMEYKKMFDHVIMNDALEDCVKKIEDLIALRR